MTTHAKRKPTLQERLATAEAIRRIWIEDALPDQIMHSWCGAKVALVESDPGINLRGAAFMKAHARCSADSCVAEKEDKA